MPEKPPRPTMDADLRKHAASQVLDHLTSTLGMEFDDRETATKELASIIEVDSYKIARTLDLKFGWNVDEEIVESLWVYAARLHEILNEAEKKWAEENDIRPSLAIGTRVRNRRGEPGRITAVSDSYPARYELIMDGDEHAGAPLHSRRIEKFEDVEPIKNPVDQFVEIAQAEGLELDKAEVERWRRLCDALIPLDHGVTEVKWTFEDSRPFKAWYACEDWLRDLGCSIGRTQRHAPIGVIFEPEHIIMKWRNLSETDRSEMHGLVTGDRRTGPVTFTITKAGAEFLKKWKAERGDR